MKPKNSFPQMSLLLHFDTAHSPTTWEEWTWQKPRNLLPSLVSSNMIVPFINLHLVRHFRATRHHDNDNSMGKFEWLRFWDFQTRIWITHLILISSMGFLICFNRFPLVSELFLEEISWLGPLWLAYLANGLADTVYAKSIPKPWKSSVEFYYQRYHLSLLPLLDQYCNHVGKRTETTTFTIYNHGIIIS